MPVVMYVVIMIAKHVLLLISVQVLTIENIENIMEEDLYNLLGITIIGIMEMISLEIRAVKIQISCLIQD